MLFNSLDFFIFLPIVFLLYWFVFNKSIKLQNALIFAASYFFYGWWDWRFVFLLLLSTLIGYVFGLLIYSSEKRKTLLFWLSIACNLGLLGVFKYYNFFAENLSALLAAGGWKVQPYFLNIVLPVGISFYTFHGMSYIFDIYRRKIDPEKDFISYAVFVSFFPLLIAGPIERATHLLPQVIRERKFNYLQATDGLRLILWGLFKKVVIADSLAPSVNEIFSTYQHRSGSELFLGLVYFAFQIYGDFSGYSDIAIGTAKLLGFELLTNFKFPFISKNVTEFWRRWHISLSTWLSDYLFTPLIIAWRDRGKYGMVLGLFITFFLSGLWHGAGWTFIIFGVLHGVALIYEFLTTKFRRRMSKQVPRVLYNYGSMLLTFLYTLLAWTFFRASTIHEAFGYLANMFSPDFFTLPAKYRMGIFYVIAILFLDWLSRRDERVPFFILIRKYQLRFAVYIILTMMILNKLFNFYEQEFIYFHF